MELVEELIHPGEGISVLDRLRVESPIVNAEAEGAICLASKENGRAILRDGGPDPTLLKVDGELPLEFFELGGREAEGALLGGVGVRHQVDPVEGALVGGSGGFLKGGT
jgi:hypothetical protein